MAIPKEVKDALIILFKKDEAPEISALVGICLDCGYNEYAEKSSDTCPECHSKNYLLMENKGYTQLMINCYNMTGNILQIGGSPEKLGVID